jgi:ABC-type branched-subunit amino acid transport system substrate-binding protein
MCVLIKAIKNAGTPDREKIQSSLKNISYEGVSGTIGFDAKGNRNNCIGLVKIKDGVPSGSYH